MFNVEEAAEYFKISKGKMYDLINNGEIEYLKIGNRKVIPGKVLHKWIEENLSREEKPYQNNITEIRSG